MPRMNGNEPKIEIFTPFGAAYELMKTILFRPFDLSRWFVIAFAAFLSGAWGNGGFNPGRLGNFGSGNWKYRSTSHGNWASDWAMPAWGIVLIIVGALVVLALILVLMWVTSRGRFIFTDCVVRNRAAIAEPWHEFRREGNSFFLFSLAIAFVAMLLTVILILIIVVPLGVFSGNRDAAGFGVTAIITLIVFGLAWVVFSLFFALVSQFMVPVMYRRRCSAKDAFLDVARLVLRHPGPFILLVLFGIVLALAVGIIGTVISCLTCCIGGLPYVSTVLLLPAIVWLLGFKLLFLRQFGDEYDVWATVGFPAAPDATPPAPPLPPPITPA